MGGGGGLEADFQQQKSQGELQRTGEGPKGT